MHNARRGHTGGRAAAKSLLSSPTLARGRPPTRAYHRHTSPIIASQPQSLHFPRADAPLFPPVQPSSSSSSSFFFLMLSLIEIKAVITDVVPRSAIAVCAYRQPLSIVHHHPSSCSSEDRGFLHPDATFSRVFRATVSYRHLESIIIIADHHRYRSLLQAASTACVPCSIATWCQTSMYHASLAFQCDCSRVQSLVLSLHHHHCGALPSLQIASASS